jgi:hypothetical protein
MSIKFGKPLSASIDPCDSQTADRLHCYYTPSFVPQQSGMRFYDVKRREGRDCSVVEDADGVEEVSIAIEASGVEQYREALNAKYGNASGSSKRTIENGFGATMDVVSYNWAIGTFEVFLSGPENFADKYGEVHAYSQLRLERMRREHAEDVQKKAQQF